MRSLLALIALVALPTEALRVLPSRRSAVIAGASLVPSLVLQPRAARADEENDDAMAAIARRNSVVTAEANKRKAEAEENKAFLDAAGDGLGVVLGGAAVVILGGAAYFAASIKGQSDKSITLNLDRNRIATPAERKKMGLD